ncbi:MAG: Asp-tRNA(Asn)/Glu-tRNA(Gln) amidotransferase subunit GatB [Acidimicrobiales bacterium]
MTAWESVIGLEVHCELRTETKLFCGCRNAFGDEPNTNVCPVCLGLPGSLPVLNRRAVDYAMRIGEALHCSIRSSVFHRKNYFYPDMPKDYQVSQYDEPINVDGRLDLPDGSRVGVVRAHMEEDTGKTVHVGESGRIHGADHALVDYNRAGVPLVEIVSAPDLRSAEQARSYVSELRAVLAAIGVSDVKMEEGSLRVDANVSVRRIIEGTEAPLGTRCEIKNLNSLRSLGRAIDHEVARQVALLEAGERVVQETRHWNEDAGATSSLRSKEEAFDYRYFPEPDLVPVQPDADWLASVRSSIPILPAARRARLAEAARHAAPGGTGSGADADVATGAGGSSGAVPAPDVPASVALLVERGLDELVLGAIDAGVDARLALTRAANELAALPEQDVRRLGVGGFAKVLRMEASGALTSTQAKQVLAALVAPGAPADPEAIARSLGFEALGSDALTAALEEAIAAHPGEWARLGEGDAKLMGFFVGKVMAATAKKADGKAVTAAIRSRLG